jgi:riboflavin-specific deaminase-like protein
MSKRPFVIVSAAQSLDGYIDDASPERLLLSNAEDFDRVDELRASVDAILVGANTIRHDNPRLLVRSSTRQAERVARGLSPNPIKVTLVDSSTPDPQASFFTVGPAQRLVYCPDSRVAELQKRLSKVATIIGLGKKVTITNLLADLAERNIGKLMVEGGSSVLKQFFASGLVDELRITTAGFWVGDERAPKFVQAGTYPFDSTHRMSAVEARLIGDGVYARYLSPEVVKADAHWMSQAIQLSRHCPPSETAYSVGAIIVGNDGQELSRGYSRELEATEHAEEAALRKLPPETSLVGATVYSTLEPCSLRKSRPTPCAQLLLEKRVARVVYALDEPLFFVDCNGGEQLRAAGIIVDIASQFADEFRAINIHILQKGGQ